MLDVLKTDTLHVGSLNHQTTDNSFGKKPQTWSWTQELDRLQTGLLDLRLSGLAWEECDMSALRLKGNSYQGHIWLPMCPVAFRLLCVPKCCPTPLEIFECLLHLCMWKPVYNYPSLISNRGIKIISTFLHGFHMLCVIQKQNQHGNWEMIALRISWNIDKNRWAFQTIPSPLRMVTVCSKGQSPAMVSPAILRLVQARHEHWIASFCLLVWLWLC